RTCFTTFSKSLKKGIEYSERGGAEQKMRLQRVYGRKSTFKTPRAPARRIARTPFESEYSSLMRLSTSIADFSSRSRAGVKRPQREPTIEISSTTIRAASSSVLP